MLPKTFRKKCRTAGKPGDGVGLWLYESTPFVYNGNTHIFIMRGIENQNLNTNTLNIYRNENNLKTLENKLIDELQLYTKDANGLPYKYWELHVTERSLPGDNYTWNSASDVDYSDNILEWGWTPKTNTDQTAWTDEDYAEATIPDFRGPNPGILCALIEEPDPEEGTEDSGEDPTAPTCTKITLDGLTSIARENINVTLHYIKDVWIYENGSSKDVLIEIKQSNDQNGCLHISVLENTTLQNINFHTFPKYLKAATADFKRNLANHPLPGVQGL